MANPTRKNVLVIGGGSVGAIAALNLEIGGLATVTLVLRSNYQTVNEKGYHIKSCDHGILRAWKPSVVRNSVPDIAIEGLPPYDYIVLTTKNFPDVPPLVTELVSPALPKENTSTTLVLLQNGLNIEKPFLTTNPSTPVISGVSLIGSAEPSPGVIDHDEPDRLLIGPYANPNIAAGIVEHSAEEFAAIYAKAGKTQCTYSPNVLHDRWRKLVYNACLNPICAITGLDTGRIRLADSGVEGLLRPAMKEIIAAAKAAAGVDLGDDVADYMIHVDPLDGYLAPSMLADVRKGNFIEYENLLGEPLREGKNAGVPMPTLEVLYNLARAIQWRTKEQRGLVEIPKPRASV